MPPREFTRREILTIGFAGLLAWPALSRAEIAAESPSLFELIDDPFLRRVLYASPKLRVLEIGEEGAAGVNQQWVAGTAKAWFIEIQRISGDLVQAGVGLPDAALIQRALPVIRWGFGKQDASGGFSGTGDAFHSTEIFIADTGRALLLLKQNGRPEGRELITEFVPKLERAALWMADPKNLAPGLQHNLPYTHRRYILACAFGMTAELTGNALLANAAKTSAEAGLALQTTDGVNPEKGGFDVNYQSAGLLFASRYFPSCHDAELRERLRTMLRRGLAWLATQVNAEGEVTTEGSTRVAGQEKLRGGKIKTVNFMELIQTLAHGARLTGAREYLEIAERVAKRNGPIGPDQLL